jgi:Mrp family chromosome partitioning ATPase
LDDNTIFHYLFSNKKVNIYDYVATRGFKTIIDFLKNYYEYILIDTPAKPLIFPEFSAISSVSDSVIVISAMETNREGLISTINKFESHNTDILGVIAREENVELERMFTKASLFSI